MQIVVLATGLQKAAWGDKGAENIVWIEKEGELLQHPLADAYIDLTFENTPARNTLLATLLPKPIIVNSVTHTLAETNKAFVRINGWTTFLSLSVIEAAFLDERAKTSAEALLSVLNKQPEWLPDNPGFITARVVSMIINEAYLALNEGVSTKKEIDTAMKLGTAYPFGPFEWVEKIGAKNVVALLQKMSEGDVRYTPAKQLLEVISLT